MSTPFLKKIKINLFKPQKIIEVMKKLNKKIVKNQCSYNCGACQSGGAIYGLGFIGSAVYYLSTATSFWIGVLGILKAVVWPAFLVFELLKFLGM